MVAPSHLRSTHSSYTYGCIIFSTSSAISNFTELTLSKLQQQYTLYCSCPKFREPYIRLCNNYIAVCVLEFGSLVLKCYQIHQVKFPVTDSFSLTVASAFHSYLEWLEYDHGSKKHCLFPAQSHHETKHQSERPGLPIHRPGDETVLLRHLCPQCFFWAICWYCKWLSQLRTSFLGKEECC